VVCSGPRLGALLAPVPPVDLARLRARCLRDRQSLSLFFHLHFLPGPACAGLVLATLNRGEVYLREISYALGTILPAGSSTVLAYLRGSANRPVGLLISTSLLTIWSASGVIISWMDGFRRAYQLPKTWGIIQERVIAISLVLMAGLPLTFATILVAFGSRIEMRILFFIGHEFGPLILLPGARFAGPSPS
jgi:membrane protein